MAKQWGIVMVQKQRKTEEDVYQMIPTLRRRNMGILEKYSRLREELEMVWKTRATVGNRSTRCSDPYNWVSGSMRSKEQHQRPLSRRRVQH